MLQGEQYTVCIHENFMHFQEEKQYIIKMFAYYFNIRC